MRAGGYVNMGFSCSDKQLSLLTERDTRRHTMASASVSEFHSAMSSSSPRERTVSLTVVFTSAAAIGAVTVTRVEAVTCEGYNVSRMRHSPYYTCRHRCECTRARPNSAFSTTQSAQRSQSASVLLTLNTCTLCLCCCVAHYNAGSWFTRYKFVCRRLQRSDWKTRENDAITVSQDFCVLI